MYQAKAAHHLRGEVPFFAAEGGAAGEGDPLRAVDRVARRVLGHEGGVAGLFDALGELAHHVVPGDLLPLLGTRRAIQRVVDATGAGGELHSGRALGTQPSLVHRAVRIALDLQQLDRAVGVLFRVGDQRTADGTIWANGMKLTRASDVEALFELSGLSQVEPEGCQAGCSGSGGADLQKIAARDLWHPIPPWNGVAGDPTSAYSPSPGAVNNYGLVLRLASI